MITKILLVLAALIAAFLIVAAFQPDSFQIERSATVFAPPARVFEQVNNLHHYQAWNPWGKFDPAARYTHEGPEAGVGAAMGWEGNSQIGSGRMTIVESRPNELVRMRLDFEKPFKSTCVTEFTFNAVGDQTQVTWTMSGPKNFVSKAMGLIMNMDKMLGDQFELGLASVKSITEAPPAK